LTIADADDWPRKYKKVRIVCLVLALLGLLSLAAAAAANTHCRREPGYLKLLGGAGYVLLTTGERLQLLGPGHWQCYFGSTNGRVPLPDWGNGQSSGFCPTEVRSVHLAGAALRCAGPCFRPSGKSAAR